MQNEIGQEINRRAKEAIDYLVEIGRIDKFYLFCDSLNGSFRCTSL